MFLIINIYKKQKFKLKLNISNFVLIYKKGKIK